MTGSQGCRLTGHHRLVSCVSWCGCTPARTSRVRLGPCRLYRIRRKRPSDEARLRLFLCRCPGNLVLSKHKTMALRSHHHIHATWMDCTPGLKKYVDVLKDIGQYFHFTLFFLGIVLLLIAFQALICYQIIPVDITFGRIILDVNAPTLSGMLLCHYAHNPYDPEHLRTNSLFFYGIMALIFVTGYVMLPANRWNPPKHFLRNVFLMIFLLLPFPLSGLAIIRGRMNGMACLVGFSDIESALTGFTAFLCVMYIITYLYPHWEKWPESFGMLPIAGATTICLVPAACFIMLPGGRNVDTAGHLVGYLYGLFIPLAVSLLMEGQGQHWKSRVIGLLVAVLVAPSVAWIVL